jgi:hypothetical protein
MTQISLDDVALDQVKIFTRMLNGKKHVGVCFLDVDGSTVILWSDKDLRALFLRALHRLEANYSVGATGLPKNATIK